VRECFLTKAPAQTKGIVSGPTLHARHRDDALLHGLARHITLDEHPKTLLGLAVAARAEKWLRRRLWMQPSTVSHPANKAFALSSMVRCVSTITEHGRSNGNGHARGRCGGPGPIL
jgi:hypothetical protein